MNKPETKKRFRFSVRTLLIVFAIVAVMAGLLSGTLNGYFKEVQVAKTLEKDGADVLLALVPPKGKVNRLLYRFGARKIFHRVINLEYDAHDQITDATAIAIGRLPHLVRLTINGTPISDQQLTSIAQSPALLQLELNREGKLMARQRIAAENQAIQETKQAIQLLSNELEKEQALTTEGYNAEALTSMEAQVAELRGSLAGRQNPSSSETIGNDFGDTGIRAFANHPTLQRLSILGCNVSDDALRDVLNSLDTKEDIEEIVKQRRRDELMQCGAQIIGISTEGESNYEQFDDSEYVTIRIRDAPVDFSRLGYVLPKGKPWELHLPRWVPLDNPNTNGFAFESFLKEIEPHLHRIRSIVASRDELAVWEIAGNCKSATSVVFTDEVETSNLILHAQAAAKVPHIEELTFKNAYFTDDDLVPISKMNSLKSLSIPNAVITTSGLKRLTDADLKLDRIRLPKSFAAFAPMIQESGLAKEVVCDGKADLFHGTLPNPQPFGKRFEKLLKHAEFPWPEDSPRRPEDEMLYHQRSLILALARVRITDHGIDELTKSLKRTPQVDVPIDALIDNAPNLRAKYAKQHQSDSKPHLKDWQQIAEIYGALAEAYKSSAKYEKALEMRVRQAAWAPMSPFPIKRFPNVKDLGALCQLVGDSAEATRLKQYFFLLAADSQTELERPEQQMAAWYPTWPQGIPILAPRGKQIAQIRSKKSLKVRMPLGHELESLPHSSDDERQSVKLPAQTQIAYIARSSFPIQIELEPLNAGETITKNPFALAPSKSGETGGSEEDFQDTHDLRLPPQENEIEFGVPALDSTEE